MPSIDLLMRVRADVGDVHKLSQIPAQLDRIKKAMGEVSLASSKIFQGLGTGKLGGAGSVQDMINQYTPNTKDMAKISGQIASMKKAAAEFATGSVFQTQQKANKFAGIPPGVDKEIAKLFQTVQAGGAGAEAALKRLMIVLEQVGSLGAQATAQKLTGLSTSQQNAKATADALAKTFEALKAQLKDAALAQMFLEETTKESTKALVSQNSRILRSNQAVQPMMENSVRVSKALDQLAGVAAGTMLGFAVLQRSITGMGFSLLFMKFNVVSTAFAVAGLVVAIGLLTASVKSYLAEGNKMNEMLLGWENLLNRVTKNNQQGAAAMRFQIDMADAYGISIADAGKAMQEFVKYQVLGADNANRLNKAAADLAASVDGMDAGQAASVISRGIREGSLKQLQNAYIRVNGLTEEQFDKLTALQREELILSKIEEQYSGNALKRANTLNGSIQRIKNSMSVFFGIVGGPIVKAIEPLFVKLANFFKKLADFGHSLTKSKTYIDTLNTLMRELNKLLTALGLNSKDAGDKIRNFLGSSVIRTMQIMTIFIILLTRLVLVLRAVGSAIIYVLQQLKPLGSVIGFVAGIIKSALDGIISFLKTLKSHFELGFLWDALKSGAVNALGRLINLLPELAVAVKNGISKSVSYVDDFGRKFSSTWVAISNIIKRINLGKIISNTFDTINPRKAVSSVSKMIDDVARAINTKVHIDDIQWAKNFLKNFELEDKYYLEVANRNRSKLSKFFAIVRAIFKSESKPAFRKIAEDLEAIGKMNADNLNSALSKLVTVGRYRAPKFKIVPSDSKETLDPLRAFILSLASGLKPLADDLRRVFANIAKIFKNPELGDDIFRAIADLSINITKAIAKGSLLIIKSPFKVLGKLLSLPFAPVRFMGKQFGKGMAEALGKGVASGMGDEAFGMLDDAGKAIAKKAGSPGAIAKLLKGWKAVLGQIVAQIILTIGVQFLPISDKIKDGLEKAIMAGFMVVGIGLTWWAVLLVAILAGVDELFTGGKVREQITKSVGEFFSTIMDAFKNPSKGNLVKAGMALGIAALVIAAFVAAPVTIPGAIAVFVAIVIAGLIMRFKGEIYTQFKKLPEYFTIAFKSAIEFVKDNWQAILYGLVTFGVGFFIIYFKDEISKGFKWVGGYFVDAFMAVKDFIAENWKIILKYIVDMVMFYTVYLFTDRLPKLAIFIGKLFVSAFNGVKDTIVGAGRWVAEKLIEGISAGISWFYNKLPGPIKSIVDKTFNGFKEAFGIHSPAASMVPIGEAVTGGIAMGMLKGVPAIAAVTNNIVSRVTTGLNTAVSNINSIWSRTANSINKLFGVFSNVKKDIIPAAIDFGSSIPENIASGISGGSDAVANATNDMLDTIYNSTDSFANAGTALGEAVTTAVSHTLGTIDLSKYFDDKGIITDKLGLGKSIQEAINEKTGYTKKPGSMFGQMHANLDFLKKLGIKTGTGVDAFKSQHDLLNVLKSISGSYGFSDSVLEFNDLRKIAQEFGDDLIQSGDNIVSLSQTMAKYTEQQKTIFESLKQLGDTAQEAAQNVERAGRGGGAGTDTEENLRRELSSGRMNSRRFFFSLPSEARNRLARLLVAQHAQGQLAEGGRVRRDGLYQLHKNETVIPLNKLRGMGGVGGPTIYITIQDSVVTDEASQKKLADIVSKQVMKNLNTRYSVDYL